MSQEPRIKIEDFASSYHDFYSKLLTGQLPMPCWLQIGRESYRITTENCEKLLAGMSLEKEARAHFEG